MKTVFFKELKVNFKSFLFCTLGVGLMVLSCILLYTVYLYYFLVVAGNGDIYVSEFLRIAIW